MKVIKIPVTCYAENAYIYYDENSKKGVLVDIGRDVPLLHEEIEKNGITLVGILLTHGHYDHIGGVLANKERYDIKIYAHEDEAIVLKNPEYNLSARRVKEPISFVADHFVKDMEVLDFGDFKITCLHTKGHTSGCVCFYDSEAGLVFTGDTLFKEVYGRVDLPTSSNDIKASIEEKLFTLPEDTICYCGHGDETVIGYEKENNIIKNFFAF